MVKLDKLYGFSVVESLVAISVLLIFISSSISFLSAQNFQVKSELKMKEEIAVQQFNSHYPNDSFLPSHLFVETVEINDIRVLILKSKETGETLSFKCLENDED